MKLKYLVGIGMACSMICSCSEEYMSFEGTDRIQFKTPKKYILLLIIPKAYKKIPCKSS